MIRTGSKVVLSAAALGIFAQEGGEVFTVVGVREDWGWTHFTVANEAGEVMSWEPCTSMAFGRIDLVSVCERVCPLLR